MATAKTRTSPTTVTNIAMAEVGYMEKSKAAVNKNPAVLDSKTDGAGSDNYTKYWRDLKASFQGEPYCNCFVNWIFTKAFGSEIAKKLLCTSGEWSYYTPTSAGYFKNKKQWYTSNPIAGDIIYFKNSTRIHHVGYVWKVDSKTKKVYTVEGNTSSGSSVIPNGGMVCKKEYSLTNSNIAGYGRPKYDDVSPQYIEVPISTSREGLEIIGTTSLNARKAPVDGTISKTFKQGERIQCNARCEISDGTYWFKTTSGLWISGKYVEGWIKESNGLWWYITKGGGYLKNTEKAIDGKKYFFDSKGYMLTPARINNDGSLK